MKNVAIFSEFIPDRMNALERTTKRLIDFMISLSCMIVFSPLWIAICIAIKREDGGPIIYKQERIGRFGRPFLMWKFRSMHINAENHGPQLCKAAEELDDPRLTKVGRFIRAHHLDELPQLWNVFTGDMALVGPRPERAFYIEKIMEKDDRYPLLYQIRPGVTSYATLYNGYTDTIDKMVARLHLDLEYVQKRSLFLDMKILWLTFFKIMGGHKF